MKHRFTRISTIILLSVFCAGPALLGGARAQAGTITLVTTGANNPNEWPILVGLKKKYFSEAGVDLTRVSAPSAAGAVQQVPHPRP